MQQLVVKHLFMMVVEKSKGCYSKIRMLTREFILPDGFCFKTARKDHLWCYLSQLRDCVFWTNILLSTNDNSLYCLSSFVFGCIGSTFYHRWPIFSKSFSFVFTICHTVIIRHCEKFCFWSSLFYCSAGVIIILLS